MATTINATIKNIVRKKLRMAEIMLIEIGLAVLFRTYRERKKTGIQMRMKPTKMASNETDPRKSSIINNITKL